MCDCVVLSRSLLTSNARQASFPVWLPAIAGQVAALVTASRVTEQWLASGQGGFSRDANEAYFASLSAAAGVGSLNNQNVPSIGVTQILHRSGLPVPSLRALAVPCALPPLAVPPVQHTHTHTTTQNSLELGLGDRTHLEHLLSNKDRLCQARGLSRAASRCCRVTSKRKRGNFFG